MGITDGEQGIPPPRSCHRLFLFSDNPMPKAFTENLKGSETSYGEILRRKLEGLGNSVEFCTLVEGKTKRWLDLSQRYYCSDYTDGSDTTMVDVDEEAAGSTSSAAIVPTVVRPEDCSTELALGTDYKTSLSAKFRERLDPKKEKIPPHVLQVIEEELTKLQLFKASPSEFYATCNHLDSLIAYPWGEFSDENLDVNFAQKTLDEDHYGLSDVKQSTLQLIAVEKLTGTLQGKIVCLCGPPGVGKSSIGLSIAKALNRKFGRFSVGALSDVEIKGHSRTHIGAMPGKMVQFLKSMGTANPVVLIDRIDQLARGRAGDPASAMLELLDPNNNANFVDHYLDVPIDLSKVFFVCTANDVERIPITLLNSMEVIYIAGYGTDEKMHIARDYLEKRTQKAFGIKPEQVEVTDSALHALIENYCREEGVWNLRMLIEKIYQKIAPRIVPGQHTLEAEKNQESEATKKVEKILVDSSNLIDFVGKPVFHAPRIYDRTPVGVAMALAWTAMGGSTFYIETAQVEQGQGKGALNLTGLLGDVMKESAQIAYTVARTILRKKNPKDLFFDNTKLHLHVPPGAIPKDGPSAGCTMITSLLSLAMNKPVKKDLAMTGEVTLTGKILPIGGVKEKTLAARRSGVKTIVFPAANQEDFDELQHNVKEGLEVHFVDDYWKIYDLAFNESQEVTVI